MDFARALPAVVGFSDWLLEAGAVVERDYVSGFGQACDYVYADVLRARIEDDRGDWEVRVGKMAWPKRFDADVWRSVLDSEPVRVRMSSLEEQVAFFRERWQDMAALKESAYSLLSEVEMNRWRAEHS